MFHVVDDNELLREVLSEFISDLGKAVQAFASPQEYLEYLQSSAFESPNGVLTDLHMPGMSGYELIDRAVNIRPELKFAVVSGEPDITGEQKSEVCLFLSKPFTLDQVAEVVDKLSRCEEEGASPDIGCARFGCRNAFGAPRFSCPKGPSATP